jgi:hypothetical protein
VILAGEEAATGLPQEPAEGRFRQPMHQRQHGVELDREPAVRRGEEDALAGDSQGLGDEARLLLGGPDMLEHGTRMHEIEAAVAERQAPAVGLHEPHPGIGARKEAGGVDADGDDALTVRIPGFEIVGVVVAPVAGRADIEDGVRGLDARIGEEARIHAPAHQAGDADRQ